MGRFTTIALLICYLLAACADSAPNVPPSPVGTEASTPYPDVAETQALGLQEAAPYPEPSFSGGVVSIRDVLGRDLQFSAPPQRIVIAGKALFMLANAAYIFPEAKARVVALGQTGQGSENFIALYDPQYEQKATLAGDAGAEQIVAYQPDLVLLKSYLVESLGKPIEILGIPVVYLDLETPEQYWRDLTTLGHIFGQPDRAEQIVAYYQKKVAKLQQVLQGIEKPKVLVLQYSDKDGKVAFNVPPQTWMQTIMTELAGGEPLWKEIELGKGWTQVTLEQIAAWDADKIFVISYFRDSREVVDELKQDAQWQAMRAVQQGNLVGFAGDLYSWDQPDVRWVLGLSWLAARMHPNLFPDYDAVQEVTEFYQTLYGLDEAFVNAKIIPTFSGDLP